MEGESTKIIERGEGLNIEFKRTIGHAEKIAKSIAAFANTSGGVLLIGVEDNGVVSGVKSELKELQKLEKASTEYLDPPVALYIKSELIQGRKILRVDVAESLDKPHLVQNHSGVRMIYIRVKDKSVPVPRLLFEGTTDVEVKSLLDSRHVKSLIQYLKEHDFINTKEYAKMINISEKRSNRMLQDLAAKQVLIKHVRNKNESYSLKYAVD
jgi:predicted HTH transcriptional regulator